MGINKEELHKDLIGIFEGEDTDLKEAKRKLGTLLGQIKNSIEGKHTGDVSLQDFFDATRL